MFSKNYFEKFHLNVNRLQCNLSLNSVLAEVISISFCLFYLLQQPFEILEFKAIEVVCTALMLAIALRSLWNVTLLIHGLGHSICAAILDLNPIFLSPNYVLENRSMFDLWRSFIPFAPVSIPCISEEPSLWMEIGDRTPWKVKLKGLGGPLFNLVAIVLSMIYLLPSLDSLGGDLNMAFQSRGFGFLLSRFLVMFFYGTNLLILISSRTDLITAFTGQAERLYCGNFGFVGRRKPSSSQNLIPEQVVKLSTIMGSETEIRGEQAGGGLTLGRDQQGQTVFIGHKIVNSRRGNLTQSLEASFSRIRRHATRMGVQPMESSIIGAWHYRYGTSGPPSVEETHWHEWTPAKIKTVWQIENGQWTATEKNINHRITHNGDFKAWQLFGQMIDNTRLGLWLERVLHTPNYTVGDSPKIAGVMDLLITQGMWTASVRLAYQLAIASNWENTFASHLIAKQAHNNFPSETDLNYWSDIFETAFISHIHSLSAPENIYNRDSLDRLEQDIVQKLLQDYRLDHLSQKQLKKFTREVIQAFLYNDVYRATQIFMARAQGSFGLVILSTLEADRVFVSALGQPITLGFNPQHQYSIYASEPAAIDAVLSRQLGTYRLDLNQNAGEIAVLGATDLVIYSMTKNRQLRDTEVRQRQVMLQQHPYIQVSRNQAKDPIESDLRDIPRILSNIKNTWMDPTSFNRHSAEYLLNFLITKAKHLRAKQEKLKNLGLDPTLAESRQIDLLITGVENSLWLGERFAQDLKMVFPLLSIKTLSSNQLLQKLQYDFDSLPLANESIVFAITQSGQTFPTLQVLSACDLLVRQRVIQEFFVLTGEPTSFIGSPWAQPTFPDEPFSRRIFTNGSGRRTAEPATASVAATHQTLTELLFYLIHQIQFAFPKSRPLGMTLSPENLWMLERMENEFLHQSITDILGTTNTGKIQKTRLHRQLIQGGQKWALNITETPLAWGIQALYVLITVGWAIPFGYTIPLVQTLFKGILFTFQMTQDAWLARILMPWLTLADIAIYIFGAWLWTLGLRLVQKRQLLARTGKRTLVIGDVHWVHQLLKTYVSKLFSLSYGITSLEVHGSNAQDHLLHHFGHRVVRGTLLFLGIPDGRWSPKHQSQENAVLMTAKQANGIQNLGAGPEIVAIGSNPVISHQGFASAMVLPSSAQNTCTQTEKSPLTNNVIEELRESRFGSFRRLLGSYVFFWALAKRVANFPLLQYPFWKSQSRTKVMTTAAPVSAVNLDRREQEEVSLLSLTSVANREQS